MLPVQPFLPIGVPQTNAEGSKVRLHAACVSASAASRDIDYRLITIGMRCPTFSTVPYCSLAEDMQPTTSRLPNLLAFWSINEHASLGT